MIYTSESIEKVIEMFATLPTIGRKSAQRLTYFLLKQPKEFIERFSDSLKEMKENVKFCSTCYNYTDTDPCPVCSSEKRDSSVICVVEDPNDVIAIEKTNEFFGYYHVLHGVLNPLEGITQDDIKIKELIARAANVNEIILALNPSVEGEVTTQYLAKFLKPLNIKVTRIARGIPVGSSLEYVDDATISRAFLGRIEM